MLVLYGYSTRKKTKKRGQFNCPHCAGRQRYKLQELGRYLHIFFMPVFKYKTLGRQVECQKCRQNFPDSVVAKA